MSGMIAGGTIMGGLSLYSGIMGANAAASEADRRRENEINSAKAKYASTEASTNLMKAVNIEQSYNAILEVSRAGSEQNREVNKEVQKAESTLQSSSEGLTSGRSKGREMITLQMKGAQAVHDSNTQESNMIMDISEKQDQMTNDLNNELFSAHKEMSAVLSTPGATYQQNVAGLASNTVSGAANGAMIGNTLGS